MRFIISVLVITMMYGSVQAAINPPQAVTPLNHAWLTNALALQREIDLNAPFIESTFIGTHNSYNSESYKIPLIRYVDPNHTLSIYQQLELGVRSLEFDAHWYLGRHAKREILLCHGLDNHLGCSVFDRPIHEGLMELKNWLKANPHEIVLLYIERHLDGHEPQLAAELDTDLGDFIFKPTILKGTHQPNDCTAIPSMLTKADVLKAGKQLLIVTKGCDSINPSYNVHNSWNDLVFAGIGDTPKDPFMIQDSSIGNDFKPYPQCGVDVIFERDPEHASLWRLFEDRTKLSNIPQAGRHLLSDDIKDAFRCGITWLAMDMLTIDDPRLFAAIWSWAPGYPSPDHGQCAIYQHEEGIQNVSCTQAMTGFACEQQGTHAFKSVSITDVWQEGETMCQIFAGADWHFSMPINGRLMHKLKETIDSQSLSAVWLNYAEDQNGHWSVPIRKRGVAEVPRR